MREERTPEETLIDEALVLVQLDRFAHYKGDIVGDKIKCMKLPFVVEYPMFEQRLKAFNLTYFRHRWGPLSKGVYKAWRDLEAVGCIGFDRNLLILTQAGHELAHAFAKEVLQAPENLFTFTELENVAQKFARLSTPRVKELVYRMDVQPIEGGPRLKVRDAPIGTNFTRALDDREAKQALKVSRSWLETLAIELNPNNKQSIATAIEDFHQGRILSHEEVWGNVS